MASPGLKELGSIFFYLPGIITPHAQRERGKVIDRGVHIYQRVSESTVVLSM